MRERGSQWFLLFVVKVKRPRSEVRGKASLDLGGGKAVPVCRGLVRSGWAWLLKAVKVRIVVVRSGRAVLIG